MKLPTRPTSKLADLQKRYEGIRVDTFLKDASFIIEKLETAAVDINRIFNPDAEEDLWKKYYNGDTAAFVRHLSRTMSKSQILSIRSEFEKNLEFRNIVTKYLSEFETLVSKARENERSGIRFRLFPAPTSANSIIFWLARWTNSTERCR